MAASDRRASILAEAIRIVGELGYRGFSVNVLARRCGLTTAGLLHHFGSKEAMLIALLEERDRRDHLAVVARFGIGPGDPLSRDRVREVLRAIISNNAAQPDLVRLFATLRAEALTRDHPAHAYFLERGRSTIAALAQLVADQPGEPAATAVQLHAAMCGLEMHWLREGCAFDLPAAWDGVAVKLLP